MLLAAAMVLAWFCYRRNQRTGIAHAVAEIYEKRTLEMITNPMYEASSTSRSANNSIIYAIPIEDNDAGKELVRVSNPIYQSADGSNNWLVAVPFDSNI